MTSKRLEQLSSSLKSIDCPWTQNKERFEEFFNMEFNWGGNQVSQLEISQLDKKHLNVLGTIGGGNHFAEF
jgi:RNA-splicing ligase RtcB